MRKTVVSGAAVLKRAESPVIKIDIGCGTNKKEDFVGLDKIEFPGVDHCLDIGCERWPFKNESVEEAYTSHFVEHLGSRERVYFCNELYRVLKPKAKCTLVVPHWSTCRAYGDPTHQWPPIGEFWFYYLDQKWRDENAPHTDGKNLDWGFTCDFDVTWGYGMNPVIMPRNQEFQQFALNHYRESVYDIHATLIKK